MRLTAEERIPVFVVLLTLLAAPFCWMMFEGYQADAAGNHDISVQWALGAFTYLTVILLIAALINFVIAMINDDH